MLRSLSRFRLVHAGMEHILTRSASSEADESKVGAVIICNAVLIAASTLGLIVRLFVRLRYLGGIGLDDAFCAIGWVCWIRRSPD